MSRGDARRLGLRVASPLGLLACLAFLAACGGTTPLLHPAHGLAPGKVTVGLGSTGRVALTAAAGESGSPERDLEHAAVAAGVAPWVGARVGLAGDNEAGLAWAGRSLTSTSPAAPRRSPSTRSACTGASSSANSIATTSARCGSALPNGARAS